MKELFIALDKLLIETDNVALKKSLTNFILNHQKSFKTNIEKIVDIVEFTAAQLKDGQPYDKIATHIASQTKDGNMDAKNWNDLKQLFPKVFDHLLNVVDNISYADKDKDLLNRLTTFIIETAEISSKADDIDISPRIGLNNTENPNKTNQKQDFDILFKGVINTLDAVRKMVDESPLIKSLQNTFNNSSQGNGQANKNTDAAEPTMRKSLPDNIFSPSLQDIIQTIEERKNVLADILRRTPKKNDVQPSRKSLPDDKKAQARNDSISELPNILKPHNEIVANFRNGLINIQNQPGFAGKKIPNTRKALGGNEVSKLNDTLSKFPKNLTDNHANIRKSGEYEPNEEVNPFLNNLSKMLETIAKDTQDEQDKIEPSARGLLKPPDNDKIKPFDDDYEDDLNYRIGILEGDLFDDELARRKSNDEPEPSFENIPVVEEPKFRSTEIDELSKSPENIGLIDKLPERKSVESEAESNTVLDKPPEKPKNINEINNLPEIKSAETTPTINEEPQRKSIETNDTALPEQLPNVNGTEIVDATYKPPERKNAEAVTENLPERKSVTTENDNKTDEKNESGSETPSVRMKVPPKLTNLFEAKAVPVYQKRTRIPRISKVGLRPPLDMCHPGHFPGVPPYNIDFLREMHPVGVGFQGFPGSLDFGIDHPLGTFTGIYKPPFVPPIKHFPGMFMPPIGHPDHFHEMYKMPFIPPHGHFPNIPPFMPPGIKYSGKFKTPFIAPGMKFPGHFRTPFIPPDIDFPVDHLNVPLMPPPMKFSTIRPPILRPSIPPDFKYLSKFKMPFKAPGMKFPGHFRTPFIPPDIDFPVDHLNVPLMPSPMKFPTIRPPILRPVIPPGFKFPKIKQLLLPPEMKFPPLKPAFIPPDIKIPKIKTSFIPTPTIPSLDVFPFTYKPHGIISPNTDDNINVNINDNTNHNSLDNIGSSSIIPHVPPHIKIPEISNPLAKKIGRKNNANPEKVEKLLQTTRRNHPESTINETDRKTKVIPIEQYYGTSRRGLPKIILLLPKNPNSHERKLLHLLHKFLLAFYKISTDSIEQNDDAFINSLTRHNLGNDQKKNDDNKIDFRRHLPDITPQNSTDIVEKNVNKTVDSVDNITSENSTDNVNKIDTKNNYTLSDIASRRNLAEDTLYDIVDKHVNKTIDSTTVAPSEKSTDKIKQTEDKGGSRKSTDNTSKTVHKELESITLRGNIEHTTVSPSRNDTEISLRSSSIIKPDESQLSSSTGTSLSNKDNNAKTKMFIIEPKENEDDNLPHLIKEFINDHRKKKTLRRFREQENKNSTAVMEKDTEATPLDPVARTNIVSIPKLNQTKKQNTRRNNTNTNVNVSVNDLGIFDVSKDTKNDLVNNIVESLEDSTESMKSRTLPVLRFGKSTALRKKINADEVDDLIKKEFNDLKSTTEAGVEITRRSLHKESNAGQKVTLVPFASVVSTVGAVTDILPPNTKDPAMRKSAGAASIDNIKKEHMKIHNKVIDNVFSTLSHISSKQGEPTTLSTFETKLPNGMNSKAIVSTTRRSLSGHIKSKTKKNAYPRILLIQPDEIDNQEDLHGFLRKFINYYHKKKNKNKSTRRNSNISINTNSNINDGNNMYMRRSITRSNGGNDNNVNINTNDNDNANQVPHFTSPALEVFDWREI